MHSSMTDSEYHALADALLHRLEALADVWLENNWADVDAHRTGGLLELVFADGGKVVVNKQAPRHEIWLASRAGGFHFVWDGQSWRETRAQRDFDTVFAEQIRAQAGQSLPLRGGDHGI